MKETIKEKNLKNSSRISVSFRNGMIFGNVDRDVSAAEWLTLSVDEGSEKDSDRHVTLKFADTSGNVSSTLTGLSCSLCDICLFQLNHGFSLPTAVYFLYTTSFVQVLSSSFFLKTLGPIWLQRVRTAKLIAEN